MDIVNEAREQGVVERRFDLKVETDVVPWILGTPDCASGPRPTVLIGHGGTQHKRVPNVLSLARRLVRHLGYGVVALDAPGHGDRVTDSKAADAARSRLEGRIQSGEGRTRGMQLSPEEQKQWAVRTTKGVAEWKALLDDLPSLGEGLDGPYGYWGVSMGTAIGLPFVAAEPRISCAVLGLAGLGNLPGQERFEAAARSLTIPILFMFQWSDELMSRQSGLDLFDAIGSEEKTMHINPGGHVGTPLFERDSYELFFERHLGRAT